MDHKARKADHIRINLEEDVQFPRLSTGLERYRFVHQALPELDLAAHRRQQSAVGQDPARAAADLLHDRRHRAAERINRNLAAGAQARGIAMGLARSAPGWRSTPRPTRSACASEAPDILLLANLGAVQLNKGYGVDHCRRAVEMIEADALILHLNPLQEVVQADGDWNWAGLLGKIEQVCRGVGVPVVVKEVGWGISASWPAGWPRPASPPSTWPASGGTSWSEVEYSPGAQRAAAPAGPHLRRLGHPHGREPAGRWARLRRICRASPAAASATASTWPSAWPWAPALVGLASPFLTAATVSAEAVVETIDLLTDELRIAMFCAGAGDVAALREPGRLVNSER